MAEVDCVLEAVIDCVLEPLTDGLFELEDDLVAVGEVVEVLLEVVVDVTVLVPLAEVVEVAETL